MIQITPVGYAVLASVGVIAFLIIIGMMIGKNLLAWFLWDFSGLRFAWEKIRPPINQDTGRRPPATFIFWISGLFGLYFAFFSLVSQRYESRVDIIENRANSIFTQMSVPEVRKYALSRIPDVQRMPCPKKPYILKPHTVWFSLFGKDEVYHQMVKDLSETVEDWKENLVGVDFRYANLQQANLVDANLQQADLRHANLQQANLVGANLQGGDLRHANLQHAYLRHANLQHANLVDANLQQAYFLGANLQQADLMGANLQGGDLSHANLQQANLMGAKFQGTRLQNTILWRSFIFAEFHSIFFDEVFRTSFWLALKLGYFIEPKSLEFMPPEPLKSFLRDKPEEIVLLYDPRKN